MAWRLKDHGLKEPEETSRQWEVRTCYDFNKARCPKKSGNEGSWSWSNHSLQI